MLSPSGDGQPPTEGPARDGEDPPDPPREGAGPSDKASRLIRIRPRPDTPIEGYYELQYRRHPEFMRALEGQDTDDEAEKRTP